MQSRQLDATFAALADPTRRAILARLAHGEATVLVPESEAPRARRLLLRVVSPRKAR